MNGPMKISYLYAGKTEGNGDEEDTTKVLILEDGKFVIFKNGEYLVLAHVLPNSNIDSTTITSNLSRQIVKQLFKKRWERKYNYSCLKFNTKIIDFCLDDEKIAYVLTADGHVSFVNILKFIKRLTKSNAEDSELGVHDLPGFEDLLLCKSKQESSSKSLSIATPLADLISPFLVQVGALSISISKSSLHILFVAGDNLKILIVETRLADGIPQVQERTQIQVFQDISSSRDIPILHFVSFYGNSQHVTVSQVLYKQIFGTSSDVLSASCILSLSNGCVYHVRLCSPTAELKMICNLKQPVMYLSVLSIQDMQTNTALDAIYQMQSKKQMETLVNTFKEKPRESNCLLILGKLGKITFIISNHDMPELNQTVHECQLPSPLVACATNKELLLISDLKLISVYKVLLVLKVKKEFINSRESVKKFELIPHHILMYTIPVASVINITILAKDPLVISCINRKRKIITVEHRGEASNKFTSRNIDELICQLEHAHLKVAELKDKSKMMNNVMRRLNVATSICHNVKKGQSHKKQYSIDLSFQYKFSNHNGQHKLLVIGDLHNNMSLSFIGNWSISVNYYPSYCQSASFDGTLASTSRTESFYFTALNTDSSFQFSFFIHPSFNFYSHIKLDVYLNFSFESIFTKDYENKLKWNSVSFYVNSYVVNVIDMCQIEDKTSDMLCSSINVATNSLESRMTFSEYYSTKNLSYLSKRETLTTSFFISTSRINHFQKVSGFHCKLSYSCDYVADLLFKFLLLEKYPSGSCGGVLSFIHLNGETFEWTVEKAVENCEYILRITATHSGLLAAVHLFIVDRLKDCILEGKEFKALFQSKLLKLQEMKQLLGEINDDVRNFAEDGINRKETLLKLSKIFLDLRNSTW